jgi:ADP-ribosyl-[dinitrogen reductase] hydrolase
MGSFRPDPNILKKHPNAITQDQIDEKARFTGALLGAAVGESTDGGESKYGMTRTLQLLHSIASRKVFDAEDMGRMLVRWFQGKPQGLSNLTRMALENLRAGETPANAGSIAWEDSERASDAGSVVCCVPIGLLHVKNLDGLADDAANFSRITHYDPKCQAACVGVATAVAYLVRGGKDAAEAVERAASSAGAISDDVRSAIERAGNRKPADVHGEGLLLTVELAFSALANATSFEEGIESIKALQQDGIVAGALLGAKFGKSSVPEKWVSKLKTAGELSSLADTLYKQL